MDTELLKVTATTSYNENIGNYMGELFEWTDVDKDGKLEFPEEQNRIAYSIGTNVLELRYSSPIAGIYQKGLKMLCTTRMVGDQPPLDSLAFTRRPLYPHFLHCLARMAFLA